MFLAGNNILRVLTYHRVVAPHGAAKSNRSLISATAEGFHRQMEYLAEHYQVVSLEDVLQATEGGMALPKRSVLITFDDAYVDFAEIAWPILKAQHLPVTLFVPTAYPDHPERAFWWDRLYFAFLYTSQTELRDRTLGMFALSRHSQRIDAFRQTKRRLKSLPHHQAMSIVDQICSYLGEPSCEKLQVLSWEKLRNLAESGVRIASHTRTHALLNRLPLDEVEDEICGSQEDLRREIGYALPVLCYPGGHYSSSSVEIAKREGIRLAFTTHDGHNDLDSVDLLSMRRTNITLRTSLTIFRFRLLRIATVLDSWRHQQLQQAVVD